MSTQFVTLPFESHEIRLVPGTDSEMLFLAEDVAVALGKPNDFFIKQYLNSIEALFCYRYIEDVGCKKKILSWMQQISKVGYSQSDYSLFAEAYDAAMTCLVYDYAKNEATIMSIFIKNIDTYIQGAKIVSGPKSPLHQPDAWVELPDGEVCPVEGKLRNANIKALNQIIRYMNAFSRKKGILVAQSLTVKLPENIIFVKIKP